MALNSLYPDGWFALGAAALKVIYAICIWVNSLFYGILHKFMCIGSTKMGEVLLFFSLSEISETIADEFLQARDVEKALDGFTRAVQLDPDNGEAWNNIACLYALVSVFHLAF